MNLSEDGLYVAHITGLAGRLEPARVRLERVLTARVLLAQSVEHTFDAGFVVLPYTGQVDLGRVVVVHDIEDSRGCDEMGENTCNGECVVLGEEQTVLKRRRRIRKRMVESDEVEQIQPRRLQTEENNVSIMDDCVRFVGGEAVETKMTFEVGSKLRCK